jgi:hypothetical protein
MHVHEAVHKAKVGVDRAQLVGTVAGCRSRRYKSFLHGGCAQLTVGSRPPGLRGRNGSAVGHLSKLFRPPHPTTPCPLAQTVPGHLTPCPLAPTVPGYPFGGSGNGGPGPHLPPGPALASSCLLLLVPHQLLCRLLRLLPAGSSGALAEDATPRPSAPAQGERAGGEVVRKLVARWPEGGQGGQGGQKSIRLPSASHQVQSASHQDRLINK